MNKSAKVKIDINTKKFPVSPSLYGLFFEEINREGEHRKICRNITNTMEDLNKVIPYETTLQLDSNMYEIPSYSVVILRIEL